MIKAPHEMQQSKPQDWGEVKTSQLLSYYPKYTYLDDVLTLSGKSSLHLYIDLKGCMQSLFQEWAVRYIINLTEGSKFVDTSVFSSVLEFIAFHKRYAKKRNIKLHMHFFLESGSSSYHTDIHKEYKANRKSSDFFGLDDCKKELFFKVLNKNYDVIDKVGNKIPNVSVYRLLFLEADFVPWYLMKHVIDKDEVDNSAHIIYSADKDMVQCLDSDNVFQFYKHYRSIKMLSQKDILEHVFKKDIDVEPKSEWFCMALAIVGDEGDGFKGVKGIGGITCAKILPQITILCGGSMTGVYQNIRDNKPLFDASYEPNNNAVKKVMASEDIIVRNLKLLSYKLLSDYIDGGYPADYTIERKKIMVDNANNIVKAPSATVLFNAMSRVGLTETVNEQTVVDLF